MIHLWQIKRVWQKSSSNQPINLYVFRFFVFVKAHISISFITTSWRKYSTINPIIKTTNSTQIAHLITTLISNNGNPYFFLHNSKKSAQTFSEWVEHPPTYLGLLFFFRYLDHSRSKDKNKKR